MGLVRNVTSLASAWAAAFACHLMNSTREFVKKEEDRALQDAMILPNSETSSRREWKVMTVSHSLFLVLCSWHFDRVHKQFEVPRGVKSKKLWRVELNKSWHDFLVLWHDFLGREAWFWEDQIVTRFPVSWRDFEKDLEHELGFKTNCGAILSTVARFWLQEIFPI